MSSAPRPAAATPTRELPFAGHPTLGSAHAWLEAYDPSASGREIIQECGAGLITLRRGDAGLSFAAPPLVRSGDVEPDAALLSDLKIGLVGAHAEGAHEAFEVCAFAYGVGVAEDPVTRSLNAGLGQWLIGSGRAPASYLARQGTKLGRHGVISVESRGDDVWVGGATRTLVSGTVRI